MAEQKVELIPGVNVKTTCYHCGQDCEKEPLYMYEKPFCCFGCKTVYEILNENDLCEYYTFQDTPGVSLLHVHEETFAYLDEVDIRKKILEFDSPTFARVEFHVPHIHCISCIWLLENLKKLNVGILKSEVNFARKTTKIDFNPEQVSLGKIARLLASLGYAPLIQLDQEENKLISTPSQKALVYKLAVAGFCFANIMLLSFPEYLGMDEADEYLKRIFSWLNLTLTIPVIFYSGWDYFANAWNSFKQKQINIDVPIAIGLLALFLRSTFDIISVTGPGYLDSLSGLVFFLLIGRWFQGKTYDSFAFDRDFRSYFPLAVQKFEGTDWKPVIVYDLNPGDTIRIRNMEIIPADSKLTDESAFIDYSFVTGESKPVHVHQGDLVYAGGRLIGQSITLVLEKKTSQSYLTSLWNNDAFSKPEERQYKNAIDRAARYFTWVVLGLSVITAAYWYVHDPSKVWLVITSVLMVACPCALALAAPFAYGSMLRVFGRHGLYLKNADVIERMATVNAVVFDKTGTVTHGFAPDVRFFGVLNEREFGWVKHLTSHSTHPLSNLITKSILQNNSDTPEHFIEFPGNGIEGTINNSVIRIGSAAFTAFNGKVDDLSSKVFVGIDGEVRGYFSIGTSLRSNVKTMLNRLGEKAIALLSGDNDNDRTAMRELFNPQAQLLFNQSPHEKLQYISNLQHNGKRVMMLGDGLNDSGALKQSDIGLAVTDDAGIFSPACDGILQGNKIGSLDKFIDLAKSSSVILRTGFVISFLYNAIALSFAMSGFLTPIVAAILMPISSISVVSFSSLAVNYVANRKNL